MPERFRSATALVAAIFVAAGVVSCGSPPRGEVGPDTAASPAADSMSARSIEDVLADHTPAWMKLEGVEGTGLGECGGTPCIKIFVSRPPETFADRIPAEVEGYPVKLEPTGGFEVR